MGFFASVAGFQIVSGTLIIPLTGMWTADLRISTQNPVSGNVTVIIGNLTLQGFVYRSEFYGGQTRARLVAGYGGWRQIISAQGYGSSSGVKLSTIMNDAALACGETVNVPNDMSVGNAYIRMATYASDNLWIMIQKGIIPSWYIDPKGVTQLASWPTNNVSTTFTVTDQKPDEGLVEIATEDYASWMPGCTFSNYLLAPGVTYTSAGVHYTWDNDGKFRFEVLTGTDPPNMPMQDRMLGPIQQTIDRQIAPLKFLGRYNYTISNPTSSTVDGTPVNSTLGLPDVTGAPITADSISTYTPPNGSNCHIMFLDGDPSQPICVWTAGAPTMAMLLNGTNPVARLGDQVQAFLPAMLPFIGTAIVSGSPAPVTGTVMGGAPISGVIIQGSQTVDTE